MALVRFGSGIKAASGALGGQCFSRQGGAPILRTRPILTPHTSAPALANRAVFAQARAAWRALSTAQQLTWIRAAEQFPTVDRLGRARELSPFLLFMGCAIRQLNAGVSPPTQILSLDAWLLGKTIQIEIWPGGPATLTVLENTMYELPSLIVKAQRTWSTHPGLPGQLWRVIARPHGATYACNFWPQLIAAFTAPQRLEWFRFEVTQSVPNWPRTLTSRHLVQIPNTGNELIYNGDFQIGGTPPDGWAVIGTGALTQTGILPYNDHLSGRWVVAAAQSWTLARTADAYLFTLIAGQTYTFRCAYKVWSGNISWIAYELTPGTYTYICGPLPIADQQWHTLEIPFTSVYSADTIALLIINDGSTPCYVYLDDISIRKDVY